MYPITTLSAALAALAYLYLSAAVIKLRQKHKVSLGSAEHNDLALAIEAHANFAEYFPITLILLLCAEANHARRFFLLILMLAFACGRFLHAYAFLTTTTKHYRWRGAGMMLTFISMTCLAILNLSMVFLYFY